jgi:heterodisulfide reductase subunit A
MTPLDMIDVPVTRKAMVIGGGVAGISASLDLAEQGIDTILVVKEPTIGGVMAQLNKTFPTMDCSI